jgi:hypothetical protein
MDNKDLLFLIAQKIKDPHTFSTFAILNKQSHKNCKSLTKTKLVEFTKMNIIGMRIEHYIGTSVEQDDYDFIYKDAEFERHVLCIIYQGDKFEIILYRKEGECGSGYTTAQWGCIEINKVMNFGGFGYIPKSDLCIDDFDFQYFKEGIDREDIIIKNHVFEVNGCGGGQYYPQGYYYINMDLFRKTVRAKDKRMIWIFKGKSGSGKSFLASRLSNVIVVPKEDKVVKIHEKFLRWNDKRRRRKRTIDLTNDFASFNESDISCKSFETDAYSELPEKIPLIYNIIVLGNKYKYTIDDIKSRLLGEYELHIVDFS